MIDTRMRRTVMSGLSKKQKGLVFGGSAAVLGVAAVAVAPSSIRMDAPARAICGGRIRASP